MVKAKTLYQRPHPYLPAPDQPMATQCRICYGWYDDPRHLIDGDGDYYRAARHIADCPGCAANTLLGSLS